MKKLLNNKKDHFIAIGVFNLYFFLYYWSIGYLSLADESSILWSSRWQSLLFKTSAPFLFEPIGRLRMIGIELLISPVNILIGILLGFLVYLNLLAALYMYRQPKQCRLDHQWHGLLGILPSFLTGFACCAPSFIIPLAAVFGSSVTFFTRIFRWFLPISFILLLVATYSSLKKISKIT